MSTSSSTLHIAALEPPATFESAFNASVTHLSAVSTAPCSLDAAHLCNGSFSDSLLNAGFESFYPPSLCDTDTAFISPFQPSSYFPPISEPSEISEALTPVSLGPAFDFECSPAPNPVPRLLSPLDTSVNANLEGTPARPHSSPSTFGPVNVVARPWTPDSSVGKFNHGLGIDAAPIVPFTHITPVSSPKTRQDSNISAASNSGYTTPHQSLKRAYLPIAPHPPGPRTTHPTPKRSISSEDDFEAQSKRYKASSPSSPNNVGIELNDEDTLLLRLKDEEGLSWKDIAARFQTDLGKTFQVPALQMRFKRLRERMRVWTEVDVQALRMAHDYWLKSKYEIISSKMHEFGATEKWTSKQCSRKLQEIGLGSETFFGGHFNHTPTFAASYTSSPTEGPGTGFYPFPTTS